MIKFLLDKIFKGIDYLVFGKKNVQGSVEEDAVKKVTPDETNPVSTNTTTKNGDAMAYRPSTPFGRYVYEKFNSFALDVAGDVSFLEAELINEFKNFSKHQFVNPGYLAFRIFQEYRLQEDRVIKSKFIKLLKLCLIKDTSDLILPCYPDLLKQISGDELKMLILFKEDKIINLHLLDVTAIETNKVILQNFSFFHTIDDQRYIAHLNLFTIYLENLTRLGLIKIDTDIGKMDKAVISLLKQHLQIQQLKQMEIDKVRITEKLIAITNLGNSFVELLG